MGFLALIFEGCVCTLCLQSIHDHGYRMRQNFEQARVQRCWPETWHGQHELDASRGDDLATR